MGYFEYISDTMDLNAKLARLGPNLIRLAGAALYQESLIDKAAVQERTPVATSALQQSCEVSEPAERDGGVECRMTMGGPSAPYGLYVHENPNADHTGHVAVGPGHHFLESVVLASYTTMPGRLLKRINLLEALG
jgi:hypothetical protein